ncbi:MAG: hypothetical protein EZS28_018553 [Streblomastix strix]|uniref:Reverse transcriptase domain-containing protein n=1 Tax=Streblomastix strix TaxID=222440 RepID=A0A5J4VTD5_9EUKA|nr:MAG: hypothetical protein EZS28_018553 [Streblomastix strix]
MITAPQEMEERIGELIYKEKVDGMGGRTKRFRQTWEQIGKEEFINTGFYLRCKDQNSQQKLKENKMIIPFKGTQEEKKAYQEMSKEELEEGIVVSIQQDQLKWWNHTFLIKKPNGTWRKILDASKLSKEIEKLHFKMHGLEDVQYLANQMDNVTSLDLKSAFHHITCHLGLNIAQSSSQKQQNKFSEQANSLNTNNGNNEYIVTVRMDNFNRLMRNRTATSNNIPGMDMEPEVDEHKNVGREKIKEDISVKGLVQHNIKEQKCEDKTTSSTDRQIELSEAPDKRSVSVSNRTRQSQNTSVNDKFM